MSVLKMGNYFKYVGWKDNSKKTLLTVFPSHALQLSVRFGFSRKSPLVRLGTTALKGEKVVFFKGSFTDNKLFIFK